MTALDDHYRYRPSHTKAMKMFDDLIREQSQCLVLSIRLFKK